MSSTAPPVRRTGSAAACHASSGVRRDASPPEALKIWHAARRAEDCGDVDGAQRLLAVLPRSSAVLLWRDDLRRRKAALAAGCPVQASLAVLGAAHRWAGGAGRRERMLALARVVLAGRPEPAAGAVAPSVLAAFDPLVSDVVLFDDEALPAYLEQVRPAPPIDCALLLAASRTEPAVLDLRPDPDGPPLRLGWPGHAAQVLPALWEAAREASREVPRATRPGASLAYARPVIADGRTIFPLDPLALSSLQAGRVHRAIMRRSPATERLRLLARTGR